MIEEELQPKTELERAYVQARTWEPLHSWRRGTTDLRCGRISSAVGIYLALARSQALSGSIEESEATINSVDQYRDALTVPDKLSAVRVLCSIIDDVKKESQDSLQQELIRKCLTQSAVGLASQINESKLEVMTALALIKKSSEFDVIAERLHQNQAADLKVKIDVYKSALGDQGRDNEILLEIFELCKRLEASVQNLQLMVSLGTFLLDRKQIEAALLVYENVLSTNSHLNTVPTPGTDSKIADSLCLFGDKLFAADCRSEACECLLTATFVRSRAENYQYRSLEDLTTVASHAVVTKRYEEYARRLQNILNLLEIQKTDSTNSELLREQTQFHYNLLSILAKPDAKLDQTCFPGLNEMVTQSAKFSGSPFYVNILPHLVVLVETRMDKEYWPEIIDLFWSSAYKLRVAKVYDTYIQPLSIITEQLLGGSTPKSSEHYSKVFAHIKRANVGNQQLVVFWRILIALRESTDGEIHPACCHCWQTLPDITSKS